MKENIIHAKSISEFRDRYALGKPSHPLITIIDTSQWEIGKEWVGVKCTSDLYMIAIKDKDCGMDYGRQSYDFQDGVMTFLAPNQVVAMTKEQKIGDINGWAIFFHPDLIRNMPLGDKIDDYKFFSYDVHEALHLSEAEEQTVIECIHLIRKELEERIDNHSQTVISSTLELILNFANRFYERQFNTRSAHNSDVYSKFEKSLKAYYADGKLLTDGIPSVEYFAEQTNLSPNYLSDLLKKQTGKSAKDHINSFVVDKAKTLLLKNNNSVSEIAYSLGFNYPHYFSRLFKSKTGMTPQDFRHQVN